MLSNAALCCADADQEVAEMVGRVRADSEGRVHLIRLAEEIERGDEAIPSGPIADDMRNLAFVGLLLVMARDARLTVGEVC